MKFKKGELYIVYAHDHSTGEPPDAVIKTVGWYLGETKRNYRFTSWEVISDDEEIRTGNPEYSNIIKGQIIRKIKL